MSSSNKGRPGLVGGADIFDDDLMPTPDPMSPLAAVVGDYYWGAGVTEAPTPVDIPYDWIAWPLHRRPTDVINAANITSTLGAEVNRTDSASIRRYGQGRFDANLDTAVDIDPSNLAAFLMAFYDTPRPRQPTLVFNLAERTEAERWRILRVGLAQRARITSTPASWPPGAANFTVEGIAHVGAVDRRVVIWTTSAIVGVSATTPGPWWGWDASTWDSSTDQRPF